MVSSSQVSDWFKQTNGLISVPSRKGALVVDYLVQGAGGGAGSSTSGVTYPSGGAGGISRTGSSFQLSLGSYTITIGAGGSAVSPRPAAGTPGTTSSFGSIASATGGGGGSALRLGGSNDDFAAIAYTVGASAGGGSGAGAANSNQNGGAGVSSSITGSSVGRGGGGAGSGSGGATGTATDGGSTTANATANLGGGGGSGGGGDAPTPRNGGSGVVIVRWVTTAASGLTVAGGTQTTSGIYTVATFNATDTLVVS
jgi:hypothetical protein